MSNRQPNERGPGGSQHDSSPYKRARPQSPSGSQMRPGPAYYQDPRFGMAVAAVAAGGYGSIYRDPFQAPVEHPREVREQQFGRDRIPVAPATSRDADLLQAAQLHKQRRPTLLDYHHNSHNQPGVDRGRQYRPDPPSAYGQHYRQDTMGNLQGGLPTSLSSGQSAGPTASKRPRLGPIDHNLAQPLSIDVSQSEPKREPAYNPQTEAISPTIPPEETKVQKVKDELLQNISRIDREIQLVEGQIGMKMKKKQQQEEAANKQKEKVESEEIPDTTTVDMKHQSIAQIIYAENRKKATEAHHILSKLGPRVDLPMYNQPSDTPIYHENKRKFSLFKPRLILHFKKRHQARKIRERYLTERYDQLMQTWVKNVEKWENNPKRKAKEAKMREYYEKIFPELKKARDDKDRLSRSGTRVNVYARSEAELEQIMDGIHEQEEEDRKMRNLAVIPPMMLDARQRSLKIVNKNGLITDCMEEYKERKYYNVWTTHEKQIFKEKYLQHPKNFGLIASFLEKKNTMDCVEYYYRSKKSENYKQMLRKQTVKKKRQQQKAPPQAVIKEEGVDQIPSTSEVVTSQSSGLDDTVNIVTSSAGGDVSSRPDATVSSTGVKDKEDDDKDTVDDSSDDNDAKGGECEGGVHPCAICKTQLDHYGLSRPLTTRNCELYGIIQSDLTVDMRVCSNCWCKSVRRRYTQCPVPSCKTPKKKVKRLRPLPTKWAEMPAESKQPIMKDLQITDETMKCCSACFNRIARRMGTTQPPVAGTAAPAPGPSDPQQETEEPMETLETTGSEKWTDEEIELAKKGLREHGKDWVAIANVVGTKSDNQCLNFYNSFKKKYNLESISVDKEKEEDNRTVSICESVASTVTAPSDGEQNFSDNEETRDTDDSGTASAPSPRPISLDERGEYDQKPDSSRQTGNVSTSEVTTSLMTHKSHSTSEGSLRSIPDNDSTATLSADEGTQGERNALVPAQQQTLYPGGLLASVLPAARSGEQLNTRGLAQVGAMGLGLVPRPVFSPSQSPGNSNQGFPSRPGSRTSPAAQGQGHRDNRPNSHPSSSHEVPIIREANPNQPTGANPNALDFSQGKPFGAYQQGRDLVGQSRRPNSAMSEPGISTLRALSPHLPPGTQPHMLIGLDPSRIGTPPQDKKPLKSATCVRDLIHSAIERNLSQDTQPERQLTQDRPKSTDTGYRPGSQPMPHDLRATDLRKDPRGPGYDPRGSPYSMPPGRDPRDMRGDPRDHRGPQPGGMDLSIRQSEGDKVVHGYKGDPRDFFDSHGSHRPGDPYRGQMDDPQQRKVITMATPPPAHSHSRSPFQMQEPGPQKGRPEGMEKSPGLYQDRHSPNVRGLPPASSPYSPHGGKGIPPPPPLINSTSSRLPKSPPTSHLQAPPSGSITHGTPVGPHSLTTTSPSMGVRPPGPAAARGSITAGTPVRETGMGRGMMHQEGVPRGQGQYDIHVMEQMRGVHPQQVYDPRAMDPRAMEQLRMHHPAYQQPPFQYSGPQGPPPQPNEYSSKQTIMSDYVTSRQMGRHQSSPTDKDMRDPREPRDPRDTRDPRDQSISPRAPDHQPGPSPGPKGYPVDPRTGYPHAVSGGMYMQPGQGQPPPSSSRVSPRPTSSMPSPRDDKSGSPWMMGQRPSHGGHPGQHPGPHMDLGHQYQGPPGRPSITQGTGRQSVITDSRSDERYRNMPDSSGAHHSPRMGPAESYLPLPSQTGDHRRSPAVPQEYVRQQMERERQEKEMKDREKLAMMAAREQYHQGVQRFNEEQRLKQQQQQHQQQQQQEAEHKADRVREDYLQKVRGADDPNKRSPKLTQPSDLLKAFTPDVQQTQRNSGKPSHDPSAGKGNRSMTAACLIDAIIVHQINQSSEDTPTSSTGTSVSQSTIKSGMKTDVKTSASQSTAVSQMYRQGQPGQPYPQQGHAPGGHVSQGHGYMPQGQPPASVQSYPGQPYQGQKGQQESKSPPAQMAGKKRWMTSPVTPPSSAGSSYSPGASNKSDQEGKPDSRPSSRGSGGAPQRPQDSALRQAVLGNTDTKQMTLGDTINSIILMDYEKKKEGGPAAGGKSFLSQINGSIQSDSTGKPSPVPRAGLCTSTTSENTTTWSTASSSTGSQQSEGQNKTPPSFSGHKKFKWRQANEQATSSGHPMDTSGQVSQSGPDDQGSRLQEVDWTRQMRPDQSHSPNVTGGQPTSPPGQADSSSSSMSTSSVDVKSGGRKGMGIQDSEVSRFEYVQNKIAQCLQDDTMDPKLGQGHTQGQPSAPPESQHPVPGRSPHPQMMPQPTHSASKSRTQSPVSSQMAMTKENSHKHSRPEPRQGGPVVSTSVEMLGGLHARQQDVSSVSPSSSSQPSPDQHGQEEDPRGGNYQKLSSQAQSPVSSAGDNRDQVHSSQHPHRKGRMFSRPRSRMEQEEPDRKPAVAPPRESMKQLQRASPSASVQEGGRAVASSDKKGPKSEYDFPDSPDDEARGKPSSYMALSSSTRSPRRGIVDSSENRVQGGSDGGREGEVESSENAGAIDAKVSEGGSGKDNEAQGFERFGSEQMVESSKLIEHGRKIDDSQVSSRHGSGSSLRKQSSEADDGSNISNTSADSTERLMVDESASIDSSAVGEVTSAGGSRRSSKSSRESDNSPHPSTDFTTSAEHSSHSRQGHRSRSPRSYPQSSSDLGSNVSPASSVQYSRRGPDGESEPREQEPQLLLSSQYETLSDDEQS